MPIDYICWTRFRTSKLEAHVNSGIKHSAQMRQRKHSNGVGHMLIHCMVMVFRKAGYIAVKKWTRFYSSKTAEVHLFVCFFVPVEIHVEKHWTTQWSVFNA